ncbi:MAG TPA: 2-dehydropantoate 2-reductase [Candidatus Dormibacteraeota bacterium]|nr:2-dehydropantoate 2-reductase [Candidatus Dormibacteraeota bacterium]
MRHAVLGPGGVGGVIGAALAGSGSPVTFITRDPDYPTRVSVESDKLGSFEAEVAATTRLDTPVDVLWVTTKATQLEAALPSAPAALVEGTVVPLLNGADHVGRLRELYAAVTPGTIRVEAEKVAAGRFVQRGAFIRVELCGVMAADVAEELEAAGIEARVANDELGMLWRKLVMLAPLALTTTATMRSIGGVRDDPRWRERLLGVFDEACDVAGALGARVDREQSRGLLLAMPDFMRSSMQKDREQERPLELDAIAGPIVRGGREHGIPTPHTSILQSLLG